MTLTNSVLYNNSTAQVYVTGQAGGIEISDWSTGQNYNLITSKITLTGNTFDAQGATEDLFEDQSLGGSDWSTLQATLTSSDNDWWNPSNSTAFTVPSPSSGSSLSFSGWQSSTGQDSTSRFAAPAVNPAAECTVAADTADWWLTLNNFVGTPQAATGVLTADAAGNAVGTLANKALGDWTGTVTLAVDGVSSIRGATVTFNPPTIAANGSTTMTFKAGASTPAGTYTFVVLANSGNITRTVTIAVTVPTSSVRISTDALNFGSVASGFSSGPQAVTFTNTGNSAVSFSFRGCIANVRSAATGC